VLAVSSTKRLANALAAQQAKKTEPRDFMWPSVVELHAASETARDV
jgi:hypothetical protein